MHTKKTAEMLKSINRFLSNSAKNCFYAWPLFKYEYLQYVNKY